MKKIIFPSLLIIGYVALNAFVKLFNIEGKCIQINEITVSAGKNKSNIQSGFLPKGIYLVSLFLDNNVVTRKIAIN